jgi:DNA repair exonuclease SbcCD ATPase subunit
MLDNIRKHMTLGPSYPSEKQRAEFAAALDEALTNWGCDWLERLQASWNPFPADAIEQMADRIAELEKELASTRDAERGALVERDNLGTLLVNHGQEVRNLRTRCDEYAAQVAELERAFQAIADDDATLGDHQNEYTPYIDLAVELGEAQVRIAELEAEVERLRVAAGQPPSAVIDEVPDTGSGYDNASPA